MMELRPGSGGRNEKKKRKRIAHCLFRSFSKAFPPNWAIVPLGFGAKYQAFSIAQWFSN